MHKIIKLSDCEFARIDLRNRNSDGDIEAEIHINTECQNNSSEVEVDPKFDVWLVQREDERIIGTTFHGPSAERNANALAIFDDIMKTIKDLLETADSTGCSADLTVVSSYEIDRLRHFADKF